MQRIQNGQHNSMYTSQQSVENKVGGIPGWQALLTAVGFRLDPPASGLPAAVFFPTSDPGDRLQQCSTTIQSLLGKQQNHELCPHLSHQTLAFPCLALVQACKMVMFDINEIKVFNRTDVLEVNVYEKFVIDGIVFYWVQYLRSVT